MRGHATPTGLRRASISVALLVMTDGRDEVLDQAVASALETLGDQVAELWMHDDTDHPGRRRQLERRYPRFRHIGARRRMGFGGAIGNAWTLLDGYGQTDHVFHLEDDFLFRHPVDLASMAAVLAERPYLAQLALRRQPWNAAEAAAGGIVEQHPDDYVDVRDGAGRAWLEHRRFFTTNPCLYRRELCSVGWPSGRESEGHFGLGLLASGLPWGVSGDAVRFGFWGARDSGEWVEHIGHQRVGTGY